MEVVVTNPSLSAGQKIGIVAMFVIFALIVYVVFTVGKPRQ